MFKTKTAVRLVVLSTALTLTSLCALGQIVEPPRPRVLLATPAVVSTPKATIAAANVRDVDQPARAPFQVTVPLNINNFTYTNVVIPAGQRLVIEYVSISGAATSSGGPVQPIAILSAGTSSNPSALFYIAPTPSATLPSQFYSNGSAAIYADTLAVAPAFAGYTPSFLALNVVISGHLVSLP